MAAKKKVAKAKSKGRRAGKPLSRLDEITIKGIDHCAEYVYTKINKLQKPSLKYPVRSLSNVRYDKRIGHFQLGRSRKERTLSVNTVKSFAQSLKLMSLSKEMVVDDDFATKREAYYVSKNWGDAKFNDQPESDACMDDIEAMFSLEGVNREQLRFFPEERGGTVVGELVVVQPDKKTNKILRIDCTGFGSGA